MDSETRAVLCGADTLCELDFRPYQTWLAELAVKKQYCYVAADMGLGKTAISLKAASEWIRRGIASKVLVIAPLEVARNTWPAECRKWSFAQQLRFSVVCGTKAQRERAVSEDADLYFINRENIPWLYWHLGPRGWFFDALIYDEATRLKSGRFRTAKVQRKDGSTGGGKMSAFAMLCARRSHFRRVLELSGTPTPQGVLDLWGPVYLMDLGKRLFPSRQTFLQKWFHVNQYTYEARPRDGAVEEIMERVSDVLFSLRQEDYLTLPETTVVDHWVELPDKALKTYRRLQKDAILEEHDIEAVNDGVLAGKLLQFANGAAYDSEGNPVYFHDAKLKKVESILEEANGSPILLFYSYKFDLDRLRKKFPFARVFGESEKDLDDWNAGRIRLLLAHPASAGHGLNFQYGGHLIVWYGLTWNLEYYLQANKRLSRPGQKHPVFIHRVLAKGTYDALVAPRLQEKEATQDYVMDTVKVLIEENADG